MRANELHIALSSKKEGGISFLFAFYFIKLISIWLIHQAFPLKCTQAGD